MPDRGVFDALFVEQLARTYGCRMSAGACVAHQTRDLRRGCPSLDELIAAAGGHRS